jgi:hypothetical protein
MDDFRDFEIVAIVSNLEKRVVEIRMRDPGTRRRRRLLISGVLHFVVNDYRLQNVVLGARCFSARENSFEFNKACSLLGLNPDTPFVDEASHLTYIQASVGAEVACLSNCEPLQGPRRVERDWREF